MKLSLFVVGKKAPDWIQTGIEHYQKQLPSSINFRLVGIEAQNRKLKDIQQIKNTEGKLLIDACSGSNIVIAFDEKGSQQSTKDLAKHLNSWQHNGDNVALLIGGADGLSDECKSNASNIWSLSKLTLPHLMARLLVVEQLYRANSLLTNHPYHRE